MTRTSFVLELVSLWGENELGPRPQNEILVPFRGSFQNFRRSPPTPFIREHPPGFQRYIRRVTFDRATVRMLYISPKYPTSTSTHGEIKRD